MPTSECLTYPARLKQRGQGIAPRQQEYRLLRAVKNRFGSVNELGVFQMTEEGLSPLHHSWTALPAPRPVSQ